MRTVVGATKAALGAGVTKERLAVHRRLLHRTAPHRCERDRQHWGECTVVDAIGSTGCARL